MLELRYSPLCASSRTVVLLVRELCLDFRLVEEKDPSERPDFQKSKFPLQHPTLTSSNSLLASGATAICELVFEQSVSARDALLGCTIEERSTARSFWSWSQGVLQNDVTQPIIQERILKNFCGAQDARAPNTLALRSAFSRMSNYVKILEGALTESQYFCGDRLSIADFSLASNMSILDYLGLINWDNSTRRLKHWYALLKSRPSFKSILSMKLVGFQPSRHYLAVDF